MYIRIKYRPHATRSHLTIHEEKKCELITTRHANSQIENNGLKVLLIAYAFSESLVKVMPFLKRHLIWQIEINLRLGKIWLERRTHVKRVWMTR